MATDLPLACRCGKFRGIARGMSAGAGCRVVCYCDDCQRYAHLLGGESPVLDAHGGTDIFQTSPARLEILQGIDRLACLRLSDKGPLRWYTDCCKTPIGNTPATRLAPFVGLVHSCMAVRPQELDRLLGPVQLRVMGRFALGDTTGLDAHEGFPFSYMLRMILRMLGWRLRGDHRRHPFFDATTGRPIASVRNVSAAAG